MSAPEPTPAAVPARITLYSRPGCHLCDQARVVIEQICAELGESYVELDIDDPNQVDPEVRERMTDEIPVTFVDGAQHDFWRVDPVRLRSALRR
ncbi:glutaredoxin family protein [Nocardioides sp.]|uniref:glutaredoxin family protein n=1 Tax=Nocardioides sp. TaxID=35761 RepID=UPI00262EC85F|nr:glutaredoxin family protein [Nocardioides sp.]